LELAVAELRTLLERFANYKLLDIVIDDTRRDQSLREHLRETGKHFYDNKYRLYRDHFDSLFDSICNYG
jgi:hypothetical protein